MLTTAQWLILTAGMAIAGAWLRRGRERGAERTVTYLVYLVGLPYLALVDGAITATELGLIPPRAITVTGATALIGAVGIAIGLWSVLAHMAGGADDALDDGAVWAWPARLELALALEMHWAFYRACLVGLTPNGLWWGVGLAVVEVWAWPGAWAAATGSRVVLRAVQAVMSGLAFALSGQLVVALGAHLAVVAGVILIKRPTLEGVGRDGRS